MLADSMEMNTLQISNLRIGLESGIAHSIAHNLLHNIDFDAESYLENCLNLFLELGLDEDFARDIIDEGHTQGLLEYSTDSIPKNVDFASQIMPSENPRMILTCTKLVEMLKIPELLQEGSSI
jgi:hypothetical protein